MNLNYSKLPVMRENLPARFPTVKKTVRVVFELSWADLTGVKNWRYAVSRNCVHNPGPQSSGVYMSEANVAHILRELT